MYKNLSRNYYGLLSFNWHLAHHPPRARVISVPLYMSYGFECSELVFIVGQILHATGLTSNWFLVDLAKKTVNRSFRSEPCDIM